MGVAGSAAASHDAIPTADEPASVASTGAGGMAAGGAGGAARHHGADAIFRDIAGGLADRKEAARRAELELASIKRRTARQAQVSPSNTRALSP